MPFGESSPLSTVFTSRLPPRSVTAYTSFNWRVPTNTVPLSPCASERAPGRPSAHTSTVNPGGTLSLSIGRSFAALPVISIANGCSVDSACAGGLPWCQEGGAAGLSWACTLSVKAAETATARTLFMGLSPLGPLLELKARLDANTHIAARRRFVIAAVRLVDDDRTDVIAVGEVIDAYELHQPPVAAALH